MASQTGTQTIHNNILRDISESKGNQIIKFEQFIEYDMSNICI